MPRRVYLASRSPRRAELLRQIGVEFDLLLLREARSRQPDVDETRLREEPPGDYVCRIARTKAEIGYARVLERGWPDFPVLAADTAVSVNQNVFGKPKSAADAESMLRMLSGKSHQVFTAVAVADQKGDIRMRVSVSTVEFRRLTDQEILSYLSGSEAYDKAGAYAVQGKAAVFISRISGSYSGIMGLPLYETAQLLEEAGTVLFP
jgi:septum formation protein